MTGIGLVSWLWRPAGRSREIGRVALLGGSLQIETGSRRCAALVRLPLTPGHARSR